MFWKGFDLSEYAAAFCVIDDLIEISHGIICGNLPVLYIKERKRWKKTCILDTGREYKELHIESVKFFKQMVILKFKEIASIDEVMQYKGKDLLVTRDQAVKLEENEYFICDLIGLKVVTDEGEDFGVLTDVIQTGANDVYAVKCPNGKEVLLPVIDECILDVDLERQQVTAHIMPGLVD